MRKKGLDEKMLVINVKKRNESSIYSFDVSGF